MSSLTEEAKRIKRMRKSYNDARKQVKEAMAQCSAGTNTHLAHIKALAEIDSNERAEEIALGLSPANLGAMVTTSFVYVAHCPTIPANKAELEKLLHGQMVKACADVHYEPEDEAIRQSFEESFPTK